MPKIISFICSLLWTVLLASAFPASAQTKIFAPERIVDKCIQVHGGKKYEKAHFKFSFRNREYIFDYRKGDFEYTRSFINKSGQSVSDKLTNSGFSRTVEDEIVDLPPRAKSALGNSVNSVHYFLFLPFFLNDPAVNLEYLGTSSIKGSEYYKIRVTFDREGGGKDYDDIYVYWIHRDTFTMDYFAYSFHTDGGGVRFREAFNPRKIGGIRFQDYINYSGPKDTPPEEMDSLYNDGALEEMSRIITEDIVEL